MSENVNLLDNDLTSVDPSYPLLPAGAYTMKVADIKIDKTKDNLGDMVVIKLQLDQQAKDVKGRTVFPGLVVTDRISLQTTPKYDVEQIQKRLKAFQLAFYSPSECPPKFAPVDQYLKRNLVVKLRVESDETGQYDDSNRVAKYVPKE